MEQMKYTEWAKEPKLVDLKKEFQASKAFHDQQLTKIRQWADLNNVTGNEKPKKIKGRSSVQPRLVRRQAEWRYSALSEPFLNTHKVFQVNPRTFEDFDAAKQNEILLNYQFDTKLNKVKFIDEYVKTVVDEGTAIVRVGWNRVTHLEPRPQPVFEYYPVQDEQTMQMLQQNTQLKYDNPKAFDKLDPALKESVDYSEQAGQPVIAQMIGEQLVPEEIIDENHPVVEIMNPANVFIDPSCQGDINKAMFIIVSFETSRAELQKTGLYINLDKVDWDTPNIGSDTDHETTTPNDFGYQYNDGLRKRFIAYEYWGYYDINNDGNLVPIVTTWINDTIIRISQSPFPDEKLPFIFVQYLPVKRSVYGEPDAELLGDNQRILGAVTRGMIDLLGKSANSQQAFAKGMLDPIQKRRFENGQDYEFNPNIPIQNGYMMHTYPEASQTAFMMLQMQNQDAEALTGVKAFSGGLASDAYGDVATGIKGMLDAAAKREMAILRRLAKGITDIGNKIISMNSVFLSDKETIRITNQQPAIKQEDFLTVDRESLKGNFDLVVDINTAEVDNTKAQDLGFMLQTLGPNMDPQITMMVLSEIADLKRMPKLADALRHYQPQPDPMEEEKKKLEIEELKSKIELNRARAANANADAQFTAIDSELTASGVKHAQEMAKQKAQAEGNQELEIVKALGKHLKEGEKAPNVDAMVGYNLAKNQLKQVYNATH